MLVKGFFATEICHGADQSPKGSKRDLDRVASRVVQPSTFWAEPA